MEKPDLSRDGARELTWEGFVKSSLTFKSRSGGSDVTGSSAVCRRIRVTQVAEVGSRRAAAWSAVRRSRTGIRRTATATGRSSHSRASTSSSLSGSSRSSRVPTAPRTTSRLATVCVLTYVLTSTFILLLLLACGICCVSATHLSVCNHVLLALRFVKVLLKSYWLIDWLFNFQPLVAASWLRYRHVIFSSCLTWFWFFFLNFISRHAAM